MKKIVLVLCALLNIGLLRADGFLDANFGEGYGYVALPKGFYARGVAIQDDAKIVITGLSTTNKFQVIRYNFDGNLDSTFNGTGIGQEGPFGVPFSIIAHPDGSLIVVGQDSTGDNFQIAKYTTAGLLDTTFGTLGIVVGPNGFAVDSALQLDGKIVAAGNDNAGNFLVVRYNANGTIDTAFDLGPLGFAESVKIQNDGKVLVAGTDNAGNMQVVRYNDDGSLDNTFGTGGVVTGPQGIATSLVIQSDGYYVIGGYDLSTNPQMLLVRFNNSGFLDNSFGVSGVVTGPQDFLLNGMALQSDGSIVAGGQGASNIKLTRYDSDGDLDISFGISGITTNPIGDVFNVALGFGGYIITVGTDVSSNDFQVARYTSNYPLTALEITSQITNAAGSVVLEGTAQNPSQIFLYLDGIELGSVDTDSMGADTWTFTTTLSYPGLYTLRAVALYKNGNSSSAVGDIFRIYG